MCSVLTAQHEIFINNKKLLSLNQEDDNSQQALVIKLKERYTTKSLLSIRETNPQKGWIRKYDITNEQDKVIVQLASPAHSAIKQIPVTTLLKKLDAGKKYFLYTYSLPSDPAMAAAVRIRRYLLCTITVE